MAPSPSAPPLASGLRPKLLGGPITRPGPPHPHSATSGAPWQLHCVLVYVSKPPTRHQPRRGAPGQWVVSQLLHGRRRASLLSMGPPGTSQSDFLYVYFTSRSTWRAARCPQVRLGYSGSHSATCHVCVSWWSSGLSEHCVCDRNAAKSVGALRSCPQTLAGGPACVLTEGGEE